MTKTMTMGVDGDGDDDDDDDARSRIQWKCYHGYSDVDTNYSVNVAHVKCALGDVDGDDDADGQNDDQCYDEQEGQYFDVNLP